MRKALYLSLLAICMSISVAAQQLTAETSPIGYISSNTDDEVRPPKLLPPVAATGEEDALLFRWEQATIPNGAEAVYEFILTDANGLVYSIKTKETSLLYNLDLPHLVKGANYSFLVNTFITNQDRSYIIYGKESTLPFTYIPECTIPKNVQITDVGDDYFYVSWGGRAASPGEIEYKIRSRETSIKQAWSETTATTGNSIRISNAHINSLEYEVEICKVCYWEDGSTVLSDWVKVAFASPEIPVLPPFTCGAVYNYPPVPCSPPLNTPNTPKLFIGGFPIEVQTLTPVGEGSWSGTGLAPLPFGNQSVVSVSWTNVKINSSFQICQGDVVGISDSPINYPDLDPGPAAFGGEICVPPPSTPGFDSAGIHNVTGLPWDPNGFGPDGDYVKQPPYPGYQPGFPYDTTGTYDPNGFDVDGNHALTGTQYNPQGCSADGIDSISGQPCNPNIAPYSWMDPSNGNPATQAGLAYVNEIQDTIGAILQGILNTLSQQAQDSLEAQQGICDGIRTEMLSLVGNLNIEPTFLFGPDSQYFAVGMHQNFSARPEPQAQHFPPDQRKAEMKSLEDKHIDLYDCDVKQYVFVHIQEIIADLLGTGFADLKADILDKISKQPQTVIDRFRNEPGYLLTWLTDQLKIAVQYEYLQEYGNGVGGVDNPTDLYFDVAERTPIYRGEVEQNFAPTSDMLAMSDMSGEFARQLLSQAMDVSPEDIDFEYLQGFKNVKGVHRAYYMDAMVTARENNLLTVPNPTLMPIAIANIGSDGRTYRVYLDNIRFRPNQPATMDAYAVVEFPGSDQRIVFEALNVEFTPFGLILNPLKIQLANDVHIRLNNVARLKLLAGDKTFVAFDCNGFAGLGINADVELCRSVVIPYDLATGNILPEPERVNGHFETYAPNFSDIYVSFSMDPFVINGLEDVKWQITGVALDMSESKSPLGAPPAGYATPFADNNGFKPLWKGFFVEHIIVTLPEKFNGNNGPVSVGVHNLLIDDMGVSCSVKAQNVLNLNQGNAGGWAFSIKDFELTVLMNSLSKAEFNGKVHVPIFRSQNNNSNALAESDCFNYKAMIQPGNLYQFSITQPAGSSYAVDMWKAGTVTINSSSIELKYDGSFHAVANLSGSATVDGDLSPNIDVNIPTINFQNVRVSNEAPYFDAGEWSFPSSVGAKLAGFELTFSDIGMYQTENDEPALKFNAFIGITDDTSKIKAEGGFRVVGELTTNNGRQRWVYKNFKVTSIHITGGFPGVPYLEGFADFYEGDPVYGTGFRGGLGAQFEAVEASIQVVGQFGRVSGFKYFFLDALVCVGPGVIPMGPIDLRGLGGGLYYHMNRPDNAFGLPACSGNPSIPPQIGASLSGIVYTPDMSKGIGIKLTAAIALTSSERAFNANATFEMLFNEGGGLDRIWLYGNAKFMDDLDLSGLPTFVQNGAPNNDAAISANLEVSINFQTKVFHGNFDVYANVAGVLVGADNGRVCNAELHFASKEDWYIKIGSPGNRAGLILTVPDFGNIGEATTYLQIGTNIDGIPPLPEDIASLTGLQETRKAQVENGSGFCFGVDVQLGAKDFNFLMFYAGFSIHLGFDVSVLNYGTDAVCEGQSDPIGINGWYAEGQVYAGIQGNVGIKVKIFGKRKEFNLMELKVAAALEAKLPNPFWARGAVGFEYNILNGLIKGHGNMEFEIGKQCTILGQDDPFSEVPLILSTNPTNNARNVIVAVNPTVRFNFPVGSPFEFEALNGGNISYEVELDEVTLKWRNLYEIPVQQTWSADGRTLTLSTGNYLPGKDTFTLTIRAHVDSSGVTVHEEERNVTFVTGPGLTNIPPGNVSGSYPLDGQFNFYKNEIADGKGYIKLKRGQPELFFEKDEYDTYVRFRGAGTGCIAIPLQVDAEDYWEKKIEFDLPLGFLANEGVYEMQVVDFPKPDANYGEGDAGNAPCECEGCTLPPPSPTGTSMLQTTYSYSDGGEGLPPSGPPPATPPTEQIIYSAYFRVSQYNTFMDKMAALEQSMLRPGHGPGTGGGTPDAPGDNVNTDFSVPTNIEPFDAAEMIGNGSNEALVKIKFDPGGNNWSGTWYLGLLKRVRYPFENQLAGIGIPSPGFPNNTVTMTSNPSPVQLKITKAHFTNGLPANFLNVEQKIRHFTPKAMQDYNRDVVRPKLDQYLSSYGANILSTYSSNLYNNICEPTWNPCYCLEQVFLLEEFNTTYTRAVCDALCGLDGTVAPDPFFYPVRVTYKLPGLDQQTYNNIIKLRP
jgi:hypothetical protein